MSELRVRYMASLRERLGTAEERLALPGEGANLDVVLGLLEARHGADAIAALCAPEVRLALNQELVDRAGLELAGGDELAFLPPVTGG